jgi:4-hydroxy-tetrahydrodipicolinate synthase
VINDCAGGGQAGNIAPALAVGIYDLTRQGRLDEAKAAQSKLSILRGAYSLGTFPAVLKEAASMLGLPVGPTRRPVGPISPEARERLRRILSGVLGEDALRKRTPGKGVTQS